jgi:hypothetical protein
MKKPLRSSLILTLSLASTSIYAQGMYGQPGYGLGAGEWGLKVDYFSFTNDAFQNNNLGDGVYVGYEAYGAVMPNFYLGGEVGWTGPSKDETLLFPGGGSVNIHTDLTYVPIEINFKYAVETSPQVVWDLGAGFSYNYFNADVHSGGFSSNHSDWVWGGQFFGDLNYKLGNGWYVGLNAKYQIAQDITLYAKGTGYTTNTAATNWRIGGQIGMTF